jgi:hypothetical protein
MPELDHVADDLAEHAAAFEQLASELVKRVRRLAGTTKAPISRRSRISRHSGSAAVAAFRYRIGDMADMA